MLYISYFIVKIIRIRILRIINDYFVYLVFLIYSDCIFRRSPSTTVAELLSPIVETLRLLCKCAMLPALR